MVNEDSAKKNTDNEPLVTGVPGRHLLQFAGTIDSADLDLMSQAIEEGCEQIDLDEW
jgi:hypothetical protein